MQEIRQIGDRNWSIDEIKVSITEFLDLYEKRPIPDNGGGMLSPHMFATWFFLKKLNPVNVIESGVWKGQGTWLIENTLPEANVYSIDINLNFREYISDKVTYFDKDFNMIDWSFLKDKDSTLLFFDDHQNAVERIKKGKSMGFTHFIFEDNYPEKQGDCYSLKKAFQHAGYKPIVSNTPLKSFIQRILWPRKYKTIRSNGKNAAYLKKVLDIYFEFPPVFKKEKTRWRDRWNEEEYPTSPPLYTEMAHDYLQIFDQDALHYTWICFAKVKKS